ncbi:MAG: hypothetical protein HYY30_13210 [Chloroflexi bacterium]|nr:hypothetical protein [Chloroflexota bacterium]
MGWWKRVSLGAVLVLLLAATGLSLPIAASTSTIWSIGIHDDSNAEFSGSSNSTFIVGSSPTSQFPPSLVGKGSYETVQFNLASVSSSYLTVLASRSAANTGSGLQPIVNGHYLTPRWASTWQYNRTTPIWPMDPTELNVDQGVIYLRWAIPPEHLTVGANTITLRVVATDFGDGATPSFDFDFLSLDTGTINLARPKRYLGTTDYWTDDAMLDQMKRNDFDAGGEGRVWLSYLFNQNTLDADLETLDRLGVKAAYPDLTWSFLEPAPEVWNDAVFDYYRYTFEQLRDRGIRVVAKIQYTPRWASTVPTADNYDRYPPENEQDWIDFLTEVGRRLGDVVDWWAIMNEVDVGSFWKGTMPQYYVMMRDAYDVLKASDTVDADGDGTAAYVVPSASAETTDYSYWRDMYANVYPKMDAFQAHDYRWGIEPGIEAIGSIDPRLPVIVSEYGPGPWFVDETIVKEFYPFAAMSMTGYVLRNPNSPVNTVMNWLFKGDPDRNGGPWPDPSEYYHPSPSDPLGHDDGYSDNFNSSIANYQPTQDGPPLVSVSLHSAGAYSQHQMWLQNLDGDQYPVDVISPAGTGQFEVSAIRLGASVQVLVSNFEGGTTPVTRTFTFKLSSPWSDNKLDIYAADNYLFSDRVAGSLIERSVDVAMGMVRVVVSDAANPVDAAPGLDIVDPAAPGPNSSIVIPSAQNTVTVDARDDVGVASVEYRLDPINRSSYVPMNRVAGSTYQAAWDARGLTGVHTIEVRIADGGGQAKTRARVVRVGDPSRVHVRGVYSTSALGDPRITSVDAGTPIYWKVQLADGTDSRYHLAGASVSTEVLAPDGKVIGTYRSAVDTSGRASFSLPGSTTASPGPYRLSVTGVTPPTGKTYDPSANVSIDDTVLANQGHSIYLPYLEN